MDHVDTTYYVEQILNDDTLTGKQMIKAPLGEVPEIYKDVINKNEVLTASLDGVSALGMYAQDVTQPSTSKTNIPNSAETVNTEATIPDRIEQLQQRLNELPMKLSREGINIQNQINEIKAQQQTVADIANDTARTRQQADLSEAELDFAKKLSQATRNLGVVNSETSAPGKEFFSHSEEMPSLQSIQNKSIAELLSNRRQVPAATRSNDAYINDADVNVAQKISRVKAYISLLRRPTVHETAASNVLYTMKTSTIFWHKDEKCPSGRLRMLSNNSISPKP